MDVNHAISTIESILAPKSLIPVQIYIIRGAIAGKSYQEIAAAPDLDRATRYQIGYIRESGAQLWQSLSRKLKCKVSKKNLVAVLVWYSQQLEQNLGSGQSSSRGMQLRKLTVKTDWGRGDGADNAAMPIQLNGEIADRFYGRTVEITTLIDWCINMRCRLVSLAGMGGVGKTTLVWELAHQLEPNFDRVIWRSLLNAPSAKDLGAELLHFLNPQLPLESANSVESQLELLIGQLTQERCLVILDQGESILQSQIQVGQYTPGYEDYDHLFKAIGELQHQSCVILVGREQPPSIARSAAIQPRLVRSYLVGGLGSIAAHDLVRAHGCTTIPAPMWQEIYAHYSGNPLALKIAAIAAVEMTGGGLKILDLYPLMKQGKLRFRDIDDILDRQFGRLSPIEQQLVYWLAIECEPITRAELRGNLLPDPRIQGEIPNALQSLLRRCIAIRQEHTWSLQPAMMAYVTARVIAKIVSELSPDPTGQAIQDLQHHFSHLNTYAILKAQAKDYLRQAQTQLILRPILDLLLAIWGNKADLDRHCRQILSQWQTLSPIPPGYLAGNILNLLVALGLDRQIKDLDCAELPIWSAYLVDINLNHVNFAAATFDRSVFTQTFGGIISVAVNPTGELVATGDGNGDIHLWRIGDGQRINIFRGHSNWTRYLSFNPDGRMLASAGEDLTVRLWDTTTGKQLALLANPTRAFRSVNFSHGGQQLAITSDDMCIRIYLVSQLLADADQPGLETNWIQELTGHTNVVFSAVYSPDLSQLASTSADGTVRLWDVATGTCLHVLAHQHWVMRTFFSPDGGQLVVSGMSPQIYVWDTHTGILLDTLIGHTDWIWSIALSADGNTIVSAGEDRNIHVWDLKARACQQVFRAHEQRIWSVAIAPDGKTIISGSEDRTIKVWDLQRGKCLKTINGYGNWVRSIALIPDRDRLISGHHDQIIRVWQVSTQTCIHRISGHTEGIETLAVSPDGRYFASSSPDRTIRIWNLADFTCLHTIDTAAEGVWALVFSPDSCQLIAGGYHAQLNLWDVATGRLKAALPGHLDRIQAVAVCLVPELIATACRNTIRIWDLDTGQCLHSFTAHSLNVTAIAFSTDGRYLASGGVDKTAKIWDTTNWECVQTFAGHQGWVLSVAFSPTLQGDCLITTSCDRLIKRWDLSTGKCLHTYTGHTNWVWAAVCGPGSDTIISASEDETIKIWETNTDADRSTPLHTMQIPGPYAGTNITGATGLLPGQRQMLKLLDAIED